MSVPSCSKVDRATRTNSLTSLLIRTRTEEQDSRLERTTPVWKRHMRCGCNLRDKTQGILTHYKIRKLKANEMIDTYF